jgi:hypothetical protein
MADTRTTPGSRSSTAASTGRLPSARERRPALAALAVLLIVGGAFASGWLALQAGNREQYLVLDEGVSAGEEITADNVDEIDLPENVEGLVPADQPELALGKRAAIQLLPGTILTTSMVSDDDNFLDGDQQLVPLAVKPSELPEGLDEGEIVSLVTGYENEEDGPEAIFYATAGSQVRPDQESSVATDEDVTLNVLMNQNCVLPVMQARNSGFFYITIAGKTNTEPGYYDCTSAGEGYTAGADQGNGDG